MLRTYSLVFLCALLSGCAAFSVRDPLRIDLVGIEPLAGQGMEVRFAALLRVQNPNDSDIDFNGVSLELDINHQPLASGVSAQTGFIPRYGETILRVPVGISAFSAIRQAWAASGYQQGRDMPYEIRGKLENGLFGTLRFTDEGRLDWPNAAPLP